ncbi:MAG: hypothetical protein ACI9EZ_001606 [Halobacteriales archaeon]
MSFLAKETHTERIDSRNSDGHPGGPIVKRNTRIGPDKTKAARFGRSEFPCRCYYEGGFSKTFPRHSGRTNSTGLFARCRYVIAV